MVGKISFRGSRKVASNGILNDRKEYGNHGARGTPLVPVLPQAPAEQQKELAALRHYSFLMTCSFQIQFTFTEAEVEPDREGGGKEPWKRKPRKPSRRCGWSGG
jgi:hypothetical protein